MKMGRSAPDHAGTIDVDRREYVLGDSVEVRVSITGLEPLSPGRIVLAQTRTTEEGAGGEFGTRGGLYHQTEDVAGVDVAADATGAVDRRVVLEIPPNAVPSVGPDVQWLAVAAFDEGAIFKTDAFNVLAPRETFLDLLHPMPDEQPGLRLEIDDRCVRCGGSVDGRLV